MNEATLEPIEGVLVETINQAVTILDPYEKELGELEGTIGSVVYDLTDEDQQKAARADRLKTGKVISRLDKAHANIKAPLLDASRKLDSRRKEIKDRLLAVQANSKGQLRVFEEAETARVSAIAERIQAMRDCEMIGYGATAAIVEDQIGALRAEVIDDSYGEWKGSALLAKTETLEKLEVSLEQRKIYEAEQAELERLRAEKEERERAEREARIAVEAAAKAKHEAEYAAERARLEAEQKMLEEKERAERHRREAEKNAARELAEANARAERAADVERGRIEREREAKAEREAAEARVKKAHRERIEHREDIEAQIRQSLYLFLDDDEKCQEIIDAVKDGSIPHLEIVY